MSITVTNPYRVPVIETIFTVAASSATAISGQAVPYVPVDIDLSADGNVSITSHATAGVNLDAYGQGNLSISGESSLARRENIEATGQFNITGEGNVDQELEIQATSDLALLAEAEVIFGESVASTGGISIGGSASSSLIYSLYSSGNISVSGQALPSRTYSGYAQGDVAIEGEASTALTLAIQPSAESSLSVNGEAVALREKMGYGTGTIAITGQSEITCWPLSFPVTFPMPCGPQPGTIDGYADGNISVTGQAQASAGSGSSGTATASITIGATSSGTAQQASNSVSGTSTAGIAIGGSATGTTQQASTTVNGTSSAGIAIGGSATGTTQQASTTVNGTASGGVAIGATAAGTATAGSSTVNGTSSAGIVIGGSATGTTSAGSSTANGTSTAGIAIGGSATGTASSFSNNYSVSCDGSDDYIDLNSNFSGVFNSSFSVAFWVNLPEGQPTGSGHSTTSNSNLFGLSDNTHRFFGLIGKGGESDAGKLRVYYRAGGNTVQARSASAFFASGATGWVHVVVTVEEGNHGIKMYRNGSAVSVDEALSSMSAVTMSNFAGNENMTFGASNREGTPNYEVNADFDEIAIFNTALSASQAETIYNGGSAYDLTSHSNLEGWWRMEEGTGLTVADSSTNSNTADLTNGATFSTSIPYSVQSLDFDGTDDYIEISDHNNFSFGNGTTDSSFSISAWAKLDSAAYQRFITKSNSSNAEWLFGTSGSSKLAFTLYDNTGSAYNYKVSTATISTGQWYHFVGTYDGSSFKLYINGSEDTGSAGSLNYTAMHNTSAPVHIGKYASSNQFNNGKLDDVAIWNSVLTSSEVASIAVTPNDLTQDFGSYVSSSNLVSFWKLEGNTDDSSGNGHNGTSSGGPTTSTDTPS